MLKVRGHEKLDCSDETSIFLAEEACNRTLLV